MSLQIRHHDRLIYVVTEDWYFCSHRIELAKAMRSRGFHVSVVTRVQKHGETIRSAGLELIPLDFRRRALNPFIALRTTVELYRIYRELRPTLVHHVAIKPVMFGSLAARLAGVPAVVNSITGLGYVFVAADLKARVLRLVALGTYRVLLNVKGSRTIVQNEDDRELLIRAGIRAARISIVRGSGVDLQKYAPTDEPAQQPVVLLASRMLWDKGIGEYVEAARELKRQSVHVRCMLAGDADEENPASIPRSQLERWHREGAVEWLGFRNDMADVLRGCHIACLPSYREGSPRFLIEAAACGKPVVTTDVPGCNDLVNDGVNGLLVAARDHIALAAAIRRLAEDAGLRSATGRHNRLLAEQEFGVERVAERTLSVYKELLEIAGVDDRLNQKNV